MLTRLLRQIIFTLVHLAVSVLLSINNVYYYYRFWVKTVKRYLATDRVTDNDVTTLKLIRLRKKVKHLVMMVDTDHHSLNDLTRVIIWSLLSGVPYVSFNDITGELKENEEQLFMKAEQEKKGIPGCIKWARHPDLNGYASGIEAQTVHVHIFTNSDGRENITECVKDIANGKLNCKRDSGQFTAQEFDEVLKLRYPSIPDPDIVLYTGSLCCTHGLLPWQIRFTEFIQISLDHRVDIGSFVDALGTYDKCVQRLGK